MLNNKGTGVVPASQPDAPDMVRDVFLFHAVMGVSQGAPLTVPSMARVLNRLDWVREELRELEEAAGQHDIVEYVDAVADAVYFLLGYLWDGGVSADQFYAAWREVQRSNTDKLTGPVRADGKRQKPDDWKPPAIARALRFA